MGTFKIIEVVEDGDAHLSSFDRRMSELMYACLLKFSCPVIYRLYPYNIPNKIEQSIHFFVPVNHENCDKVIDFLGKELQSEVREGSYSEGLQTYFPGANVLIFKYSGIEGYLEHEQCIELANEAALYIMNKFDPLTKPDDKDIN